MNLEFVFATLFLAASGTLAQNEAVESTPEYDQEQVGKDLKMHSSVFFVETFNNKEAFQNSWTVSAAKKKSEDGSVLQYDGDWLVEKPAKASLPNDLGLTFALRAKHRAVSAKLSRDFIFSRRPFVIQYEVTHQEGQECGGAYLKLISKERPVRDLNEFNDKTPYTIMFGPDKCGTVNKLHFIFKHRNPLNGSYEEKHCKPATTRIDEIFTDSKPHLFKLILNPDSNFSIYVDNKLLNEGSLLENFEPPVNPPEFIDDPNDKKPSDWDDREKIPDPTAKKPADWNENAPPEIPDATAVKPAGWLEDEPINISDPSAEKPDDWDEEMDGEWEAPLVPNPACEEAPGCGPWSPPLISNPEYKGKWSPPLINNPNFKGIWRPRKIPNPDFFEDKNPFLTLSPIDAVGFELWSVSSKIMFDNIIITDDDNVAKQFAASTFNKKIVNIEKSAETLYNQFVAFTNRYPWLWAVYIVILLIPITLIVVCCFWSTKDSDAERKKNDDLSPDPPNDSLVEESLTPYQPAEGSSNQSNSRKDGRNDNEDRRSSSVTDTDTGSVASAHEEYQNEIEEVQRNSEERAFRQGSEQRASRERSEERASRQGSEERAFRQGSEGRDVQGSEDRAAPRRSEERLSESRELPRVNLPAQFDEQPEEAAPSSDDLNALDHSDDNIHEPSAEPDMVLKKRK